MTINELLALNNLTANDQIPVWDAEATGSTEPTAKITAQNFANAVKSLASLIGIGDMDATPTQGSTKAVQSGGVYTAIQQSTAYTVIDVGTDATFPTGVSLYGRNKVYICGKLCVLMFSIKMESNAPSNISITNFIQATAAKPVEDITACGDDGLGDGKLQSVIIRNNLSMQIYNVNVGKTTYANGSVAYFVA